MSFSRLLLFIKKYETLEDLLKSDKRSAAIEALSKEVNKLLTKNMIRYTYVQKLVSTLLKNCNKEESIEIKNCIITNLIDIIHTKDGSSIATRIYLLSTTKERKDIIKGFKSHILKLACDPFGHAFLISALHVTDDTKLVQKHVFRELSLDFEKLISDKHGHLVLLYILAGKSRISMIPNLNSVFALIEENKDESTSKKDPETRQKELSLFMTEMLDPYFNQKEKTLKNHSLIYAYFILKSNSKDKHQNKIIQDLNNYEKEQNLFTLEYITTLNILIKYDSDFAKTLFQTIESRLFEFATNEKMASCVLNLLRSEATKEKASEILKEKIEDLKQTDLKQTKLIIEKVLQ